MTSSVPVRPGAGRAAAFAPCLVAIAGLLAGSAALVACRGSSAGPSGPPAACDVDQPYPYADSSYVSNHAGRENSNTIPCGGPARFEASWHVLVTHAAGQPNTFSPDGRTTYLTTTPGNDGCAVHAIDTVSGSIRWRRCDFSYAVAASAVEVDEDGTLYITERNVLTALEPGRGRTLWSTALPDSDEPGLVYGLKFTSGGSIVTQTSNGTVCLVGRGDGSILATLDVARETGFVPPGPRRLPLFLLPDYFWRRAAVLMGTDNRDALKESISGLFGASGAFADNTLATSARRQVLAIGGGPTPETGAVVAVDITGDPAAPSLGLAWTAKLPSGSATSVALFGAGSRFVVSDGEGTVHRFDVEACDSNLDGDPDPSRCKESWTFEQPGQIPGALSVDPDGNTYFITTGRGRTADLYALRDGADHAEVRWARKYGATEQLTTVLTITRNAIYGLLTDIQPVTVLGVPLYVPGLPVPLPAAPVGNRAVAIDPATGEILWSVPAPNSSITELILSPRGDLFLSMAGGAETLVLDPAAPDPMAGLARFKALGAED